MNDPRGSIWRKWDLHIHSPASHHFKGTYEDLIENLRSSEAAVIGINDYCTIEGYNEILRRGGVKGKVLFPVIEFRMHNILANRKGTPTSGGVEINFHIIFNNATEVVKRVETWMTSLECFNSKGDNDQLGNISSEDLKRLTFDFDAVIKKLKDLKLRKETLIWLPYDEYGGIDDIDPNDNFFKLGLIRKADIIGSSTKKQIEFFLWKNHKFSKQQYQDWFDKPLPCLKGSDAHNSTYPFGRLKDKDSNPTERFCGIKADTTFEGLKQACAEPEARIFIGKTPDKILEVADNKDKYIDGISVDSESNDDEWLDNIDELVLNTGLVAIIGNKGSGKSALADAIALAGNSYKSSFSFLNEQKFLELPVHRKYSVKITFKDDFSRTVGLENVAPDQTKDEKVVYLSQFFVNQLCDTKEGIELLQNEIDRVVFSHVPEEEKFGLLSLNDLVTKRTKNIQDLIDGELGKLKAINNEIVDLEEQAKPDFRNKIENSKKELERKLEFVKKHEKPEEVDKPSEEANKPLTNRVAKYSKWLTLLSEEIENTQEDLNSTQIDIGETDEFLADLDSLKRQLDELRERFEEKEFLKDNSIKWEDIVTINIRTERLSNLLQTLNSQSDKLRNRSEKIERLKARISNVKHQLQEKLGAKQQQYHQYMDEIQKWDKKQKGLIGDAETENTIEYLAGRITFVDDELPLELQKLYQARRTYSRKILDNIFEKKARLENIYKHAQDVATKQAKLYDIPITEFIEFNSNVEISDDFNSNFFLFINRNRTGTFYTIEESEKQLDTVIKSIKRDDIESILAFPDKLVQALNHNISVDPEKLDPKYRTDIENQLIKPKIELYNFLFSFPYLANLFSITYDRRNISLLSAGEKGILLLIFYLLIDKDKRPIVIDQPEENLDNETVYLSLVSYIREVKKTRQIIIVTHNPNLAIVCDADQIIYAQMDKYNNNLITYKSGSIENKEMKGYALRILEGTRPAFDNRKEKYSI